MSIVQIAMKHNDMCNLQMDDVEHNGYMLNVNKVLRGDDYTVLRIDNETGRIIGWSPIKIEDGKFVED